MKKIKLENVKKFISQLIVKISKSFVLKTSTEVLRRSPQWALNTHTHTNTHTETERKREVN